MTTEEWVKQNGGYEYTPGDEPSTRISRTFPVERDTLKEVVRECVAYRTESERLNNSVYANIFHPLLMIPALIYLSTALKLFVEEISGGYIWLSIYGDGGKVRF